jgi:hypothetical protein
VLLFFCGCRTIPSGVVGDGPIVSVKTDNNEDFTAGGAVNYMITSLVMKCRVIADAGKNKPKVINDFMLSSGDLDYLQMDVWRKLIKMNMIDAKSQISESPDYRLNSKILPLDRGGDEGLYYVWRMNLERISDKKILWKEEIVVIK